MVVYVLGRDWVEDVVVEVVVGVVVVVYYEVMCGGNF